MNDNRQPRRALKDPTGRERCNVYLTESDKRYAVTQAKKRNETFSFWMEGLVKTHRAAANHDSVSS